ncbi:helix-hairpin-helix domain-containing protein [Nocardiopsis sp. MG754419]|uniref:helix-hairpin-helix domain-containing protein n=1 Tax=Nocardiopsis sp. MG754419 TaxID=2259865 RepID=UPI001BA5B67E|nr:helix-hairpin-helix domain-containing protein [Nocardiopsis sp. MG754419]MBR8742919.1 description family protein [Nocardiopsis sp. MG754419]
MSEVVEKVHAVLDRMGAPRTLAPRLVTELGAQPAAALDADPWLLLRLPGVTVEQADFCARKHLGDQARPDDPRRLAALVRHTLRTAAGRGHTAVEEKRLATVIGKLGVANPMAALEAAVEAEQAVLFESTDEPDDDFDFAEGGVPDVPDPERFYALHDVGHAEQRLGTQLDRLIGANDPVMDSLTATETVEAAEESGGFVLSEQTREALVTVALRPVTVVRHGPGDRAEVSRALHALAAIAAESRVGIAIAAPTAATAAAVDADLARVAGTADAGTTDAEETGPETADTETDAKAETPPRAVSLAALLDRAPVEAGIVVLYEAMAVGTARMAELVSVCADGAHLVLLSNPDQAPSATPGHVVVDVAASRTAHVTALADDAEPGPLAALATAVASGEWTAVQAPDREVVRVPAASAEEAAHRVTQLVTDSIPRALGIAAEDVQVVTAREDGPAGARSLNTACKERLNPGPGAHGGFDVGDRVLVTAAGPGYGPGDTGHLRGFDEGAVVELTGGTRVTVTDPAALRHGWAITVAAAHGGLWPAVVAVFPPQVPVSRPQVYTALTRAVRHVSVVDATDGALESGIRENPAAPERTTRLIQILRGS